MTDKYHDFANSDIGKRIVGMLGLPKPPKLERYRAGESSLAGSVVIGSHAGGELLNALVRMLAGMKPSTFTYGKNQEWISTVNRAGLMTARLEAGSKVKALVFDASGIEDSTELEALYQFFHGTVRSLSSCGRIVVLGRPPEACSNPRKATAQRALEGLTRSLGKEVGRGCTSQLVYVAEGAENGIESTLRFLLSPRSAYVSAQVIRIGGNASAPQDWQRPLQGQTAVVTGASRGIGVSIAYVLAREGAQVICVDIPQAESALQEVASKIGGIALTLDVTAADAPQKLAQAALAQGGIDILVHNAGITRDKKIANMKDALWQSVINVNLSAQERINDAMLDSAAIKPAGRIVCVSSISGIADNVGQTNYGTSKAGVIGMVQSMAPVLNEKSITINAVAPGFIETQMTDAIPLMTRTAARLMNSMNQGGQPVDVAETIAWFANPASAGITGNVIRVCGQSLIGA